MSDKGIEATEKYIQSLGIKNFAIRVNEQDMYENNAASYKNWNLPLSAALLINKLFTEPLYDSVYQNFLKETLISCTTGKNRLSKPLVSRGGDQQKGQKPLFISRLWPYLHKLSIMMCL